MLLPTPPFYLRKRKPRVKAPKPLPGAPVLVSAEYDPDGPRVLLTFDRPMMLVGFDGAEITVNDPVHLSSRFDGSGGATVTSPATVEVMLVASDLPSGEVVTLDAGAASGIVAAWDGADWAGVTDVELPYP